MKLWLKRCTVLPVMFGCAACADIILVRFRCFGWTAACITITAGLIGGIIWRWDVCLRR